MLKTVVLPGLLTVALMCGQAMAQAVNPPSGAPPATDQGAPPAAAPGGPPAGAATVPGPSNKEIIAACRNDAQAKGLRGAARQSAVWDCVGAQNPQLAAQMRCRQQGRAQGIARGDAMKAFIRSCVAQAK